MWALGRDEYSGYLTDSTTFRTYIGDFDEYDERMDYNCKGDIIYIEKRTNKGYIHDDWSLYKTLDKKVNSLKSLKKDHEFE